MSCDGKGFLAVDFWSVGTTTAGELEFEFPELKAETQGCCNMYAEFERDSSGVFQHQSVVVVYSSPHSFPVCLSIFTIMIANLPNVLTS